MTRLADAHRRKHHRLPRDPADQGRDCILVNPSAIAPREILPLMSLCVPEGPEPVGRTIAAGCRTTLQTLYAPTVRVIAAADGGAKTVRCERLLTRLRGASGAPEESSRFRPLPQACAGCDGSLAVVPPPGEDVAPHDKNPLPVAKFPAFARRDGEEKKPLLAVVPAGGVFRGVFQFGAIAAMRAYRLQPDLYAGASVGTIFSLLLDAAQRPAALAECLDLALTVDEWIDKTGRETDRTKGFLDAHFDRLTTWWRSRRSAPLRELRWRDLRAVFDDLAPTDGGRWASASAAVGLAGDELLGLLRLALRGRLAEAIDPLRKVLDHAGIPTGATDEVIGFETMRPRLLSILRTGGDESPEGRRLGDGPDLKQKFLFTVTDLDGAHPRAFGERPERAGENSLWPLAVEGAFAASSFPIAFRTRRRAEVFGPSIDAPQLRYADGGIFNNFPSDTALAWLRRLTAFPEYQWVGGVEHRILLLSLTDPVTRPRPEAGLGTVNRTRWMLARAEDEKVLRTLQVQDAINALARDNNALLIGQKHEQAVRANYVYVAPARSIYRLPFAIKEPLGFDPDDQAEMIAAGCRRARRALELADLPPAERDARRSELAADVIAASTGRRFRLPWLTPSLPCVLGRHTPEFRRDGAVPTCSLVELARQPGSKLSTENAERLYDGCRRGAARDPELPDPYDPSIAGARPPVRSR